MQRIITLNRFYFDKNTTLGSLVVDDILFFTCELTFRGNAKDISSIPPNRDYVLKPHVSSKFGKCLLVYNVPNRLDILIHAGNTYKDTKGCILVGLQAGMLGGLPAVLESKKALEMLVDRITDECTLKIISN